MSAGASTRKSELSSSASITERLRGVDTMVGAFLNLGSPLAAESCAHAGFDWVLLDLEHGAATESELVLVPAATETVLRACDAAGKTAGLFMRERADAQRALERGFRFVALASDAYFLAEAARAAAKGLR